MRFSLPFGSSISQAGTPLLCEYHTLPLLPSSMTLSRVMIYNCKLLGAITKNCFSEYLKKSWKKIFANYVEKGKFVIFL